MVSPHNSITINSCEFEDGNARSELMRSLSEEGTYPILNSLNSMLQTK